MSISALPRPRHRADRNELISSRSHQSYPKNSKSTQLSLPIEPIAPPAPTWAIAILPIPPAQAIAPDRYWLACNAWRYPLQFKPDERKRLRALLLEYGWLDWAIDEERECPRCIDVLHEAIESLVNSPKSGDRGGEA